jgi:nicotinamidase-related amidase
MRAALIVVDMQQGSFTGRKTHDADGVVGRINQLADRVRKADGVVVYIQHDGPPGDAHHPSEPGWRLLSGLKPRPEDVVVRKTSCDAFLDTELDAVLQNAHIDQLIITGYATDYCVDTTVRSALARRYRTVVPSDGHTTADRPHLPALKIIEHHNAIWADFLSPVGPASLARCADVVV